jgi:hypothetical protein
MSGRVMREFVFESQGSAVLAAGSSGSGEQS